MSVDQIKNMDGGVTAAKGFYAANTAAGIKYQNRDDMALVYSEKPCVLAGTFTSNVVKAAPVLWDRKLTESTDPVRAVVINSGIANACTGEEGFRYCRETAEAASEALSVAPSEICVASTGVIGMQLPMERVTAGVRQLASKLSDSREAANLAARAIMTTDTRPKETAVEIAIRGTKVRIGGMAKGSGMIHPNMCTMLAFVTTDAAITKELLQEALLDVVNDTFNMISVDGDTSTNDTCLLFANGQAGNEMLCERDADYEKFKAALFYVTRSLARMMAGDGEGATALLEVCVKNALTKADARLLAKSVVTSSLTKAAIFGHDANWGRILCALGYAGADFDPLLVDICISGGGSSLFLVKKGVAEAYSEDEASAILANEEVTILCDMHAGEAEATAWGCDLTYDYVKINADYRS